MNHFAQLLWAKVVEFPIDGYAAAYMDRRERRIALRIIALNLVAGWSIRQNLDLVRLIQTQRIGLATFVPLPLAEGNEAHAARKSLRVTLDNPLRLVARQKRPDDDFPASALAIGGRYLENEQTLFDRTFVSDLIAAGNLYVEIERRFQTVIQMANLDHARTIFVTHREIAEQVLDIDAVEVFSRRHFGQRQRQFPDNLRPQATDAAGG